LINDELPRAGISRVEIERFPNQIQILVYTSKPGIVIGRKGATVKDLRSNCAT
jgi:small subunit ribosomal protein S3